MLSVEDVGQGPPLVMLHPVAASGRIWWQHIPRLAQRFRVLAVDLPGHGQSPKTEGSLSLEGMSAELYQTLQARNLLRIHLVGLSLGGMVAQILAVDHPSSVSSLTLCDTLCEIGLAQTQVLEERARAVEEGGMSALVESILDRWFSPGFSAKRPDVVAEVERLLRAADPTVNAQTWRAIARLNVVSRLPNLDLPALVINGSLDNSIPPGEGERLADFLKARLVELPGCAHMAPLEAPERFMDLLEPFVSNCEGENRRQ
ncbi:MAG: alpha/beta fold hydrolase [Deltaproteobacteria bacterium]|nr:MAG: alpha/beta fold hydrolase [Deltaproteobacteria bacterium]